MKRLIGPVFLMTALAALMVALSFAALWVLLRLRASGTRMRA